MTYMMVILFVVSLFSQAMPLLHSTEVRLVVMIVTLMIAYKLTQKTMEKWLAKRLACER